ncbi:MAG: hypothetical protein IPM54_08210 [Polyangiaceae bacterium]|nr:hypothetical protein [Polyangiaceae bacterium]
MIEREHRYGSLVFDRNAIVRAALRAYLEAIVKHSTHRSLPLSFPASDDPEWSGDLERGAFFSGSDGNHEVVAWTEEGVVGLAYELGFGPIEQLGLAEDDVTGGPEDVRAAVTGLPARLEPAFSMAAGMLGKGRNAEKLAGVGFWLDGDRIGGTLFTDPTSAGADRLVMWGLLRRGRLLPQIYRRSHPDTRATLAERDRVEAPIHAFMDAVVDRRLKGPTELTAEELEAMLYPLSMPPLKRVLGTQRMLEKVGITWPGSPKIPDPPPRPKGPNPFTRPPKTVRCGLSRLGYLGFDRDAIVRAAKRAYVEAVLAQLDPLRRYPFTACIIPRWKGDLQRGAFYTSDGTGDYEVIAWNEAGIVGLAYQLGYGPIEHLGLAIDAVKGGPDDVRATVPDLPADLEAALELATSMLVSGPVYGEKLASIGFWLRDGERLGGTLFDRDDRTVPGARRLAEWGRVAWGTLHRPSREPNEPVLTQAMLDRAEPIRDLVEAVAERALAGPTQLTADELATLLPTPPDPERLLAAQDMLQKVGITWPGSPEIPE